MVAWPPQVTMLTLGASRWVAIDHRDAIGADGRRGGSIPTIAPISSTSLVRMILIIKSVPILPDPMIAAFTFAMSGSLAICE
jgi:hypothetical protein